MVGVKPTPRLPPPGKAGIRRPPVERLASLKRPNPTPIRRPQSIHVPQQQQQKTNVAVPPKTSKCPNPGCPDPNIVEDDGQRVCAGCGTVISESNIVSEVTFGEASSGAAVVQGTFVGADQSHGRSFGPGFQRGGGIESREITEQNGNRYIAQLSRALNIPESASKAGGQVFKLAVGLNFIQGRRTKTVAAVALYIACRRQDGNTVMLIDFADVLMINVFKLGRAYKALLDELRLGGNHFIMNPIDPESLIYRFSKQLEFGPAMMQVASEAVRIVQRMNRDWMITGRRPAGICGAALILAARMNNFRRTVREVVYVVKVTELTIHQRLNEFKATESGGLTVDEFRSVQLEACHDPPSFSHSKDKKTAQGKKRKAAEIEGGDDVEDDTASIQTEASTTHGDRQIAARVDADGFAIPEIPIDPALLASDKKRDSPDGADVVDETDSDAKGKRTRPRGNRNTPYPEPTESELASESALEDEMTALLSSNSDLIANTSKPAPATAITETTKPDTTLDSAKENVDNGVNAGADTTLTPPQTQTQQPVSSDIEISPLEFDDDPEVQYCLLSPAEVEIKERIWVHENKDYLRTQQAKALRKALAEAGSDPSKSGAQRPRKRRKGRMGDVTYLSGEGKNADGEPVAGSRASTPAEATRLMLERRGFSKKINYQLFEQMYGDDDKNQNDEGGNIITVKRKDSESDVDRRSRSRSVSVSRSVRSSSIVSERGIYGGRASGNRSRLLKPIRTPVTSTMKKSAAPAVIPAAKVHTIDPTSQFAAAVEAANRKETAPQISAAPKAKPVPPVAEPEKPTDPNEEILGYLPDAEEDELPVGPAGDADGDDDEEEEEEDEEEDDGVEAAFAGNYYDEGSDGGYDDDYF
ncbi:transcription factor IIIB 60 kDa subunit [Arthroderma uncinatum]|uniref:transcription factor IIIB 60 kDa subunit n=1 Tax=Arthroderma uncinatum TaxID=74035 RepID=UPI00144A7E12|nr:transcription factor IIIB 60 kDa subunit [Arthroderma uncinatum]KAF3491215.1 transcription factor IIIB 60 kDa subunit [Arthroderma uncinatum]